MRVQHNAQSYPAFPVYSCAFIADDQVIFGAGGGASRTGIKNKLRLFRVSNDRKLHTLGELELEKGEDAPMSIAAHPQSRTLVCGINGSAEKQGKGENENCRKFSVSTDEHRFTQLTTCSTLTSGDSDDYQRVTVLSPNGKFLVVAGAHDFSLLDYGSFSPVVPSIHVGEGEIYDATFSSSHLFLAVSSKLLVYALPSSADDDEQDSIAKDDVLQSISDKRALHVIKTIGLPSISGIPSQSNITFRATRLHPIRQDTLYSVINVTLPRGKREKLAKRRAYVLKWKITEKDGAFHANVITTRKVCDGNLTCFDMSSDGRLLAFGASDYSVGALDSNTLTPQFSILKAHEFAITTIRFSPDSKLLVSGGVDSSIRAVTIPEVFVGQSWSVIFLIIVTLLIIVIAVLMQRGALELGF